MVSSERISPFTHLIESSFLYLIQKANNLNKLLNIEIANQIQILNTYNLVKHNINN